MYVLVLKSDNLNTSYRLSKFAAKLGKITRLYIAFGFVKFDGF